MKLTRQPGIFVLVKVVLLLNLVCSGFLAVMLFSGVVIDSFSSSFGKMEIVLDVRKASPDSVQVFRDEAAGYRFKQSKTGGMAMLMPWYAQLFIPYGLNLPFEISIPYWIFYFFLCFFLYRILTSIEIESPFSDKNIRRIFWIGYVLIFYDAFSVVRHIALSVYVENISNNVFRYDGLGPLVYYKVGILVIILAMIYRRGVLMQRERELTI